MRLAHVLHVRTFIYRSHTRFLAASAVLPRSIVAGGMPAAILRMRRRFYPRIRASSDGAKTLCEPPVARRDGAWCVPRDPRPRPLPSIPVRVEAPQRLTLSKRAADFGQTILRGRPPQLATSELAPLAPQRLGKSAACTPRRPTPVCEYAATSGSWCRPPRT